jgi:hypothetical protein
MAVFQLVSGLNIGLSSGIQTYTPAKSDLRRSANNAAPRTAYTTLYSVPEAPDVAVAGDVVDQ